MYLLSCKERKRMVSKRTRRPVWTGRRRTDPDDLPSTFVELWITVFGAWVKRIRSTPYFLLFNVFFALGWQNEKIVFHRRNTQNCSSIRTSQLDNRRWQWNHRHCWWSTFLHWQKNRAHWFDRYCREKREHCEMFSQHCRSISVHRCCCYSSMPLSWCSLWSSLSLPPSLEKHHARRSCWEEKPTIRIWRNWRENLLALLCCVLTLWNWSKNESLMNDDTGDSG